VGFLPGGDRYGVLLGIAPKLRLYRPPQSGPTVREQTPQARAPMNR
jgi:hypothetical protein